MTLADLGALVAQYRAGLEAETTLLHRIEQLARTQHAHVRAGALAEIPPLIEARDHVMASLVQIEHEMLPLRDVLKAHRAAIDTLPAFQRLTEEHRIASELVASILSSDRESMSALRLAEDARQFAAKSLEQGESTLAAYRRVVSPPLTSAVIVDRTG